MGATFKRLRFQNPDNSSFKDQLFEELELRDAVIVESVPIDSAALLDFGHAIGKPMLKASYSAPNVNMQGGMAYIGDIRFKPFIDTVERMPTQDYRSINFHTARAYAAERPRYFCMLMINQGWRSFEKGKNGESHLLTIGDMFRELRRVSGDQADSYLTALSTQCLAFKPSFYLGDVGQDALLWKENARDCFRLWEGITSNLRETLSFVEPHSVMANALAAVSKALLESTGSYETLLRRGDLILLDNRRVAHARSTFLHQRVTTSGETMYSQRQVLNLQIA